MSMHPALPEFRYTTLQPALADKVHVAAPEVMFNYRIYLYESRSSS